nr:zinc metalloproteinase nas-15-like [Penaeus vannamei]
MGMGGRAGKSERSTIAAAMAEFHRSTCIRFVPRNAEKDYIHILKGDGRSEHKGPKRPTVVIQTLRYTGVRGTSTPSLTDGDRPLSSTHMVRLNSRIIQEGNGSTSLRRYDLDTIYRAMGGRCMSLGSIMHYGAHAFASDRTKPTIIPRPASAEIGQRRGFSRRDIEKLSLLYDCDGFTTGTVTTPAPPVRPPSPGECEDSHKHCSTWAKDGECEKNPDWMLSNCANSCKNCGSSVNDTTCSARNESAGGMHEERPIHESFSARTRVVL